VNRVAWLVVALVILSGGFAESADSAEVRQLTGGFVWNKNRTGDLAAEFSPTGEGKWDVTFRFVFREQNHVYSGTAEGSLSAGELSGRVLNEGKSRTFVFRGKFEEGTFRGTHAEIEDDLEQETGTLTLAE